MGGKIAVLTKVDGANSEVAKDIINNEEIKDLVVPTTVDSIHAFAFDGCSSLTSVTIGNSVTSIEDWAFGNCSGLTSITIPNSVTSIGDWAFTECSLLETTSQTTGKHHDANQLVTRC